MQTHKRVRALGEQAEKVSGAKREYTTNTNPIPLQHERLWLLVSVSKADGEVMARKHRHLL